MSRLGSLYMSLDACDESQVIYKELEAHIKRDEMFGAVALYEGLAIAVNKFEIHK